MGKLMKKSVDISIGLDIGTVSVKAVCILDKNSTAILRESNNGISPLRALSTNGENNDGVAIYLSPYRRIQNVIRPRIKLNKVSGKPGGRPPRSTTDPSAISAGDRYSEDGG